MASRVDDAMAYRPPQAAQAGRHAANGAPEAPQAAPPADAPRRPPAAWLRLCRCGHPYGSHGHDGRCLCFVVTAPGFCRCQRFEAA